MTLQSPLKSNSGQYLMDSPKKILNFTQTLGPNPNPNSLPTLTASPYLHRPPNGELWKTSVFEVGCFSHSMTSSLVSRHYISAELLVLRNA